MRNKAMAEEEKPKTAENGTIAAAVTDEEAAEAETEAETTGDKAYGAGGRNGTAGGEPSRCGFVALLGAPNAGKSTLTNNFVGSKVSIVSPKAQTTRTTVKGIGIWGNTQIIFLDTPGIFKPKRRLDRAMVASGRRRRCGHNGAGGGCQARF